MACPQTLRRFQVTGAGVMAVALLAAALTGAQRSAGADGALVVGVPEGGLRDGFAYGRAIGGTAAETTGRAFDICRQQAQKQGFDEKRCVLITTFKSDCVAVAMDTNERWAGWAVAANQENAERTALATCAQGAGGCRIHSLDCDR